MSDVAVQDAVTEAPAESKRRRGVRKGTKRGPMGPRKVRPFDLYVFDGDAGVARPISHDQTVTLKDGTTSKGFAKAAAAKKWARANLQVNESTRYDILQNCGAFKLTPPERVSRAVLRELS